MERVRRLRRLAGLQAMIRRAAAAELAAARERADNLDDGLRRLQAALDEEMEGTAEGSPQARAAALRYYRAGRATRDAVLPMRDDAREAEALAKAQVHAQYAEERRIDLVATMATSTARRDAARREQQALLEQLSFEPRSGIKRSQWD
jgi:hypothetical protein